MWRPPGQHLVHQRAETTEVDARANLLRGELLRRHVAQRAHDHSSLGRSLQRLAQQPRDAEVDEPGVAIGPDQDVPGLDVAVDHATCMGVVKGLGDFCPDLGSRPRIERSVAFQEGRQRLALHQLEHNRGALARVRGKHPNDPWMVEAADGPCLRREASPGRGVRQKVRMEQLDRYSSPVALVPRPPDLRHPAASQPSLEPVATEDAAGVHCSAMLYRMWMQEGTVTMLVPPARHTLRPLDMTPPPGHIAK